MRIILLIVVLLSTFADYGHSESAEPSGKTVIRSDQLEVLGLEEGNRFVFSGSVTIEGADFTATCDRMEVRTTTGSGNNDDPTGFGSIKVIEATGSVRIVQGSREATAGRAIIRPAQNEIVLESNPVVRDANGTVTGYRMILFGESRRIVVEPGPDGNRPTVDLPSVDSLETLGNPEESP